MNKYIKKRNKEKEDIKEERFFTRASIRSKKGQRKALKGKKKRKEREKGKTICQVNEVRYLRLS